MSYDMIDRFLRNNLGDDDYAKYSDALNALCTPQRKPLTDDALADLWYKQSLDWMEFARAIEAAHNIKENT